MTAPRRTTHTNPYAMGAGGHSGIDAAENVAASDPVHQSDMGTPGGPGNRWWYNGNGWAPTITRDDYAGVTDPTRVEELPRVDRRANLRNFWGWWGKFDAETKARESVVAQDTTGHQEQKGQNTRAPHPLWVPPPEPRPTTGMSPHTYFFSRPFDQTVARRFNGSHLSLADNRRNYDILTMAPVTRRRNTYRVEPTPWDTDIMDEVAPATAGMKSERIVSPDIPSSMTTRAYRL